MKTPDRKQQRKLVRQWEETARELERIRREALRQMPYNWVDVDALLELGAGITPMQDAGSGMIQMQQWFLRARKASDSSGNCNETG